MGSKNKAKKYGFTLIELLVIISIIGIISTAAVISLNQAKEKAKRAKIYSEMRSIIPAIQFCIYSNERLKCGPSGDLNCNGSATGNGGVPFVGNPICNGSETKWPDLNNPQYEWYRAISNVRQLTFGIEIKYKTGIFIGSSGELGQYITCTETGCFKENWSSLISTDCSVFGQSCSTDPCCHQSEGLPLVCGSGQICEYNTPNLPEDPDGGGVE